MDDNFYTLIPPNYDNKLLSFNSMRLTYIFKKIKFKQKIKIFMKKYDIRIVKLSNNIILLLNELSKLYNLKTLNNTNYPKDVFGLTLFTPSAYFTTTIIFKIFSDSNRHYLKIFYDKNNVFDTYFINNFY